MFEKTKKELEQDQKASCLLKNLDYGKIVCVFILLTNLKFQCIRLHTEGFQLRLKSN